MSDQNRAGQSAVTTPQGEALKQALRFYAASHQHEACGLVMFDAVERIEQLEKEVRRQTTMKKFELQPEYKFRDASGCEIALRADSEKGAREFLRDLVAEYFPDRDADEWGLTADGSS